MMQPSLADPIASLRERASGTGARIVFAEGGDDRVREAAGACAALGLHAILLDVPAEARGDVASAVHVLDHTARSESERVRATLAALPRWSEMSADALATRARDAVVAAGALVRSQEADGAVSGAVRTTADVIRIGLSVIGRAPGVALVSSAFVLVLPDAEPARALGRRSFVFADCGVIPQPSPEALADIAIAAAETCRTVLLEEPAVALLSYSTHGSADGPPTQAVREAVRLVRARVPGLAVDGELQADAALVRAVAARKCAGSEVAGRANVLVFPSLDAANVAYKLVERMAGASAVGPLVQGLARPFHDLSRGASVGDIVLTACVAALQSEAARSGSARGGAA